MMQISGEDLTLFIIQDEFALKFTTETDQIILSDHKIDVQSRFFVDARILGL